MGWTMGQNACGASSGIPPSVDRPMITAATRLRIPPPVEHGGPSVVRSAG